MASYQKTSRAEQLLSLLFALQTNSILSTPVSPETWQQWALGVLLINYVGARHVLTTRSKVDEPPSLYWLVAKVVFLASILPNFGSWPLFILGLFAYNTALQIIAAALYYQYFCAWFDAWVPFTDLWFDARPYYLDEFEREARLGPLIGLSGVKQ